MTRGRDVSVAEVHEHIQRTLEHEANHRSDHDATLWCFRYVLEGWTYEEAEERFRTEAIRNCSVTSYRLDKPTNRLALVKAGEVVWADPLNPP